MVRKVRTSSVTTEKLLQKCKKMLVADVPTKWNSTYMMIKRLLLVRNELMSVFNDLKWDGLQPSELIQLEDIVTLLSPFAAHTDLFQSDTMSLSSIIPALLDLKVYLQTINCHKKVAQEMLSTQQKNCTKLLYLNNQDFEVIPAVVCFADPTLAPCLLSTDEHSKEMQNSSFLCTANR